MRWLFLLRWFGRGVPGLFNCLWFLAAVALVIFLFLFAAVTLTG
jgi:hypothetical protein